MHITALARDSCSPPALHCCCSSACWRTGRSTRPADAWKQRIARTTAARPPNPPAHLDRRPEISLPMKNEVQLIAYADRLGGTLHGVRELLTGPLAGLFGSVHLLPFFHPIDGSDAGFDPIDHTQIDERLGSWDDLRAIAEVTPVMADVIVNHISSRSPQFLDFATHGERSRYAGMFLSFEGAFPNGATERDLLAIYRPHPGLPFTSMTLADGSRRILWTTFTSEQIDIDVRHPRGIEYLDNILRTLAANGVSMIRLDAVGYSIKKPGASCFMMDETFDFIGSFT